MRSVTCARFLAAALVAGSAFLVAPAVYAEEAAPAAAEAVQEQAPFDQQTVAQHMMATIERFERDDATGLQVEATQELRPHLTTEQIAGAKAEFAPKWGARVSSGKMYMTSGQENGAWYAVCEIAVGYKETAVVYRLSYDANMNLAGIFIR